MNELILKLIYTLSVEFSARFGIPPANYSCTPRGTGTPGWEMLTCITFINLNTLITFINLNTLITFIIFIDFN
jgi:hypothetical protein